MDFGLIFLCPSSLSSELVRVESYMQISIELQTQGQIN